MRALDRLANGDIRAIAALAVTIAACAANHAFADDLGYDWEWGVIVLSIAAAVIGRRI